MEEGEAGKSFERTFELKLTERTQQRERFREDYARLVARPRDARSWTADEDGPLLAGPEGDDLRNQAP